MPRCQSHSLILLHWSSCRCPLSLLHVVDAQSRTAHLRARPRIIFIIPPKTRLFVLCTRTHGYCLCFCARLRKFVNFSVYYPCTPVYCFGHRSNTCALHKHAMVTVEARQVERCHVAFRCQERSLLCPPHTELTRVVFVCVCKPLKS